MRFRTTVEQGGKTATAFEVPVTVVEGLGTGKRPAVRVTINGFTYRSTIASMGGRFMVGVSAENRAAAGVAGGDTVEVDIELDTAPREVTVPVDLAKALEKDPKAEGDLQDPVLQQQAVARAGLTAQPLRSGSRRPSPDWGRRLRGVGGGSRPRAGASGVTLREDVC